MTDRERILAALAKLDPSRDEDWLQSGLPAMPRLIQLLGIPVTRAVITQVAPGFTRTSRVFAGEPGVDQPDVEQPESPFEPGVDHPDVEPPELPDAPDVDQPDGEPGIDHPIEPPAEPGIDQPDVEPGPEPTAAELEQLLARHASLIASRARTVELLAELRQDLTQIERAIGAVAASISAKTPKRSAAEEYRAVVETNIRARRARIKVLTEAGLVTGRARIDEAMSRRRGFGSRRPKFNLLPGAGG